MQKTFLVLVSSELKWGKQSIRKAKWGDCIMSCGIKEDADLWMASAFTVTSAAGQLAPDLPKALSCAGLQNERGELWICSLSPISTPFPFYPLPTFLHFYSLISYGSWKVVMYYGYRVLYSISRGEKGYTLSCQIKFFPKWSKLMRRFVKYS